MSGQKSQYHEPQGVKWSLPFVITFSVFLTERRAVRRWKHWRRHKTRWWSTNVFLSHLESVLQVFYEEEEEYNMTRKTGWWCITLCLFDDDDERSLFMKPGSLHFMSVSCCDLKIICWLSPCKSCEVTWLFLGHHANFFSDKKNEEWNRERFVICNLITALTVLPLTVNHKKRHIRQHHLSSEVKNILRFVCLFVFFLGKDICCLYSFFQQHFSLSLTQH